MECCAFQLALLAQDRVFQGGSLGDTASKIAGSVENDLQHVQKSSDVRRNSAEHAMSSDYIKTDVFHQLEPLSTPKHPQSDPQEVGEGVRFSWTHHDHANFKLPPLLKLYRLSS